MKNYWITNVAQGLCNRYTFKLAYQNESAIHHHRNSSAVNHPSGFLHWNINFSTLLSISGVKVIWISMRTLSFDRISIQNQRQLNGKSRRQNIHELQATFWLYAHLSAWMCFRAKLLEMFIVACDILCRSSACRFSSYFLAHANHCQWCERISFQFVRSCFSFCHLLTVRVLCRIICINLNLCIYQFSADFFLFLPPALSPSFSFSLFFLCIFFWLVPFVILPLIPSFAGCVFLTHVAFKVAVIHMRAR